MLEQYWGFREAPFRPAPRSDWFYASQSHDESLARLFYIVEHVYPLGFLTGPAGIGKSQLLSVVRQQSRRTQRKTVHVDACGLDEAELLWQIAGELQTGPGNRTTSNRLWWEVTEYLRGLNHAGIQTVLLIDHFEDAEPECQRTIRRLLHSAKANGHSGGTGNNCLTVLLATRSITDRGRFAELQKQAQFRIEIEPLLPEETADYVRTQLARVGRSEPIFDHDAIATLHELSGGIPGEIDRLANLALIAGMSEEASRLGPELLDDIAEQILPVRSARPVDVPVQSSF